MVQSWPKFLSGTPFSSSVPSIQQTHKTQRTEPPKRTFQHTSTTGHSSFLNKQFPWKTILHINWHTYIDTGVQFSCATAAWSSGICTSHCLGLSLVHVCVCWVGQLWVLYVAQLCERHLAASQQHQTLHFSYMCCCYKDLYVNITNKTKVRKDTVLTVVHTFYCTSYTETITQCKRCNWLVQEQ